MERCRTRPSRDLVKVQTYSGWRIYFWHTLMSCPCVTFRPLGDGTGIQEGEQRLATLVGSSTGAGYVWIFLPHLAMAVGKRGESRKSGQNLDDTAYDEGMVPRGVFHVCRQGKDNLGTFLSTSLKACWSTSSAGSRCCEDHQWTKGDRNQFYLYKSSLHTKVKHLGVPPSCRCRHVQYFNAWVSKIDRCKRNAKEKPCVEAGLQIHWLPSLARRGGSGCG